LDRFTGVLGILAVLLAPISSTDRKHIRWRTVAWDEPALVFAFFVLRFNYGQQFMAGRDVVKSMLASTYAGTKVLFGTTLGLPNGSLGSIFAFQVLPPSSLSPPFSPCSTHRRHAVIIRAMPGSCSRHAHLRRGEHERGASIFMGQTEARSPSAVPLQSHAQRTDGHHDQRHGHVSGASWHVHRQGVEPRHLLAAVIMTSPGTILIAKMLVRKPKPRHRRPGCHPKDELHKDETSSAPSPRHHRRR